PRCGSGLEIGRLGIGTARGRPSDGHRNRGDDRRDAGNAEASYFNLMATRTLPSRANSQPSARAGAARVGLPRIVARAFSRYPSGDASKRIRSPLSTNPNRPPSTAIKLVAPNFGCDQRTLPVLHSTQRRSTFLA